MFIPGTIVPFPIHTFPLLFNISLASCDLFPAAFIGSLSDLSLGFQFLDLFVESCLQRAKSKDSQHRELLDRRREVVCLGASPFLPRSWPAVLGAWRAERPAAFVRKQFPRPVHGSCTKKGIKENQSPWMHSDNALPD